MSEPDFLTVDDLLEIAAGVLDVVEVRDAGGLASAAGRPQTTVFGEDAYPSLAERAAALMHSLARNHPVVDGNKRLAWSGTRVFLLLNGSDVQLTVDDAEEVVLRVARGELDVPELAAAITAHMPR